jgi:hypothetical protein
VIVRITIYGNAFFVLRWALETVLAVTYIVLWKGEGKMRGHIVMYVEPWKGERFEGDGDSACAVAVVV